MGYLGTKPANQITDSTLIADGTITTSDLASGLTVNFADGSASTPSITNDGDTNTGIFFPAADTIAFAEGGVEVARFDSAGDFGIGTNNPTAKLHVFGSGTDANCRVEAPSGTNRYLDYGVGSGGHYVYGYGDYALYFGTNGTERMRINSSGQVGIGTSSFSSSRLMVVKDNATAYDNSNIEMIAGAGNTVIGFHCAGASAVSLRHVRGGTSIQARNISDNAFTNYEASAFTVSSDYRLKENIVPLENALVRVLQIPVHRFNFKSKEEIGDDYGSNTVDGFLAHEVAEVVPEAAFGEKDAVNEDGEPIYQSIDQAKLVPLLTAAIQEQQAIITEQSLALQDLKARIETLENK